MLILGVLIIFNFRFDFSAEIFSVRYQQMKFLISDFNVTELSVVSFTFTKKNKAMRKVSVVSSL